MIRVTAAVIEQDGRILIARRRNQGRFAGKWEFPGGKVEEGETPAECLERELMEELGIQAEVGEFFDSSRYDYGHTHVELLVFRVSSFDGAIRLYDHEEIRWVKAEDLPSYDFPEADRPIISRLCEARSEP